MTQEEINKFFTSDKTSWYVETDDGDRIWKLNLLRKFWELIKKEKIDKDDYSFNNFVFPSFTNSQKSQLNNSLNFFTKIFGFNNNSHDKNIVFSYCRFQGDAFFLNRIPGVTSDKFNQQYVLNSVKFSNCEFERDFRLQGQIFLSDLRITKCKFYGDSTILMSNFLKKLQITHSSFNDKFLYHGNKNQDNVSYTSLIFNQGVNFGANKYTEKFSFSSVEVNCKLRFRSNKYNKNFNFAAVQLNNRSIFSNENYNKAYFQDIEFSTERHSFEEIQLPDENTLTFKTTFFTDNVNFQNCDAFKMIFIGSDISKARFSSCEWKSTNRLKVFDENKRKDSIIELKKLENIYRQLKKIFEKDKDWELSGKAYVSEMKMRMNRLRKERNYISWCIFCFYDVFGGFNQNFIRPLKWFMLFTIVIFPSYYILFENFNIFNIHPSNNADYSVINAFIKSISASIPLIKTDLNYLNWWVQSCQTIISTILITFFILALRKRFKQ